MADVPPGTIPRDLQRPRHPGIRARAGHLGSTYQQLQPNDSDKYQYHRPGLLLQQVGIRCSGLPNYHDSGWRCAGGSGPIHSVPTSGMELRVNAHPRSKLGELRGRQRWKTYFDRQRIPPSLHLGALTGLGGGPDTLSAPIPHIVRGPQRQHQPSPEPAQSEVC